MKVAIDARLYDESGIGRYVRNLISNLQKLDNKNEYFILLKKEETDQLNANFKKVSANFGWYGISEQIRLLGLLKALKPDIVHFPHFNVPILYQGKFVVTIHDLIHQHYQMRRATTLDPFTYRIKQLGYNIAFKNAVKKSQKILVPSNYVKDLVIKEWSVAEEKIVVTYEAVDDRILKLKRKAKGGNFLEKFKIRQPYIFYIGNAHPHKNVEGLIKAFLVLKNHFKNLQLVLSGSDHYFWQRIKKEYQQKKIIFTGRVNDEELVSLYKYAKCFVMPSFEEGFGIPILEAQACECPVVSSNAPSLPEIGGEGALYFDPTNLGDMIEKISISLKDEKKRKDLIEKGKERVKNFSWKKLAEQTLKVYENCL